MANNTFAKLSVHRILFLIVGGFLSFSITALVTWFFYVVETASIAVEFEADIDRRVDALERDVGQQFQTLYQWRDIYNTFGVLESRQFASLAQGALERHRSLTTLAWAPLVRESEREAFEEKMRVSLPKFSVMSLHQGAQALFDSSSFRSSDERDWYFPLTLIEPPSPNQLVYGLDIATDPERFSRVKQARDTGNISVTEVFVSFYDGRSKIFAAYVPFYEGNTSSQWSRQQNIAGFVIASFSIDSLISEAIGTSEDEIYLQIVDTSRNVQGIRDFYLEEPAKGAVLLEKYAYTRSVHGVPGRNWQVSATPTAAYVNERRSLMPWVSGITGIIVSSMVLAYFHLLWRREDEVKRQVKTRTRELDEANEKLEKRSRTDALTGIANRRWLNEFLEREWQRAQREQAPITFLLLDVDFFKPYNDTYGHLAGDVCLQKIAAAIDQTVHRSTDLVARYGGEEFAVILPNTDDGLTVANQIRETVQALEIEHEKSQADTVVTISIGMATMVPTEKTSPRELVNDADEALYKAKEAGRNRVVVFNS